MNYKSKIYVAGHNGLVGSAIFRQLKKKGYKNIITSDRKTLDLTNQLKVLNFLKKKKPNFIFIAAAKVGGIYSNHKYKAEFIYENLSIQSNLIHSAYLCGIKNLIFLGSSCVYPKKCKQPIKENYLLSGALESTNDAYAVAKIAGIMMCQSYNNQYKTNYKCLMPTNTFGPNDNYDLNNSHVLPALIKKFHLAKVNNQPSVEIWGTGSPQREFLHVEDLAEACLFLMETYNEKQFVNIGTGEDVSIKDLAIKVKEIVGYAGDLIFDTTKPDGTPRKLMDVSFIHNKGWKHAIALQEGISSTYQHALKSGKLDS